MGTITPRRSERQLHQRAPSQVADIACEVCDGCIGETPMLEGSRFSGQLLKTRREHWWKPAYQISLDGRVVTTVNAKRWGGGVGRFRLDGQDYRLRASMRRTKYTLLNADGMVVATADNLRQERWTVQDDDTAYQFQQDSAWKADQSLVADGERIGWIKKGSRWKGVATAELPGLPLRIQVFVLATMLILWDSQYLMAG